MTRTPVVARKVNGRRYALVRTRSKKKVHPKWVTGMCLVLMLPVLWLFVSAMIWIETRLCHVHLRAAMLFLHHFLFETDTKQQDTMLRCQFARKCQQQKPRLQHPSFVKEVWVKNPFSNRWFVQKYVSSSKVIDSLNTAVPEKLRPKVQFLCNGHLVRTNATFADLPETAVISLCVNTLPGGAPDTTVNRLEAACLFVREHLNRVDETSELSSVVAFLDLHSKTPERGDVAKWRKLASQMGLQRKQTLAEMKSDVTEQFLVLVADMQKKIPKKPTCQV